MKSIIYSLAVLSVALVGASSLAAATASPAQAQHVKTVDGQSYWTGDPGPVAPSSFWTGGEYKYDPNHYLAYWGDDPQDNVDVVHADHTRGARCVWRKRVVNSDWEFEHPYLLVCRP
jgi:hypothetical protein